MKIKKNDTKKKAVKATEKAMMFIGDLYSGMPCFGRWYEPKMPAKLKK